VRQHDPVRQHDASRAQCSEVGLHRPRWSGDDLVDTGGLQIPALGDRAADVGGGEEGDGGSGARDDGSRPGTTSVRPTTRSPAWERTPFAERAGRELLVTGETVRGRTEDGRPQLTAQEAQVARLARAGLTNPAIGAQLYLSARTVEWHLRKVFVKLDIRSRRDLQRVLPEVPPLGAGARPRTDPGSRAASAASSGSPRPPSAAP
jgi:DNA-binding CsgD family transcriptional regulator